MRKTKAPVYAHKKDVLDRRLKKIEGQIRGIRRMVAENRDCLDIVQQLEALGSASREVSVVLLESHLTALISEAIAEGSRDGASEEVARVIRRTLKTKS